MPWRIRVQADDFFSAYSVLRKSSDATFNKLESSSQNRPLKSEQIEALSTMGPSIVNLAFAVELYIKDLHVVLKRQNSNEKKIKAPRGHNILELFRKLPSEFQQEIRHHPSIQKIIAYHSMELLPLYIPLDKNKEPITDILEQQIHKISDAFEKWRYSYENGALTYEESTALALIKAVKSVANTIRMRPAA